MWLRHWNAYGTNAKRANLRTRHKNQDMPRGFSAS
jgi:hypothetical protein